MSTIQVTASGTVEIPTRKNYSHKLAKLTVLNMVDALEKGEKWTDGETFTEKGVAVSHANAAARYAKRENNDLHPRLHVRQNRYGTFRWYITNGPKVENRY